MNPQHKQFSGRFEKRGEACQLGILCFLFVMWQFSYFLLARSTILLLQVSSEALFYLNPVPAKPDTFASL